MRSPQTDNHEPPSYSTPAATDTTSTADWETKTPVPALDPTAELSNDKTSTVDCETETPPPTPDPVSGHFQTSNIYPGVCNFDSNIPPCPLIISMWCDTIAPSPTGSLYSPTMTITETVYVEMTASGAPSAYSQLEEPERPSVYTSELPES